MLVQFWPGKITEIHTDIGILGPLGKSYEMAELKLRCSKKDKQVCL